MESAPLEIRKKKVNSADLDLDLKTFFFISRSFKPFPCPRSPVRPRSLSCECVFLCVCAIYS